MTLGELFGREAKLPAGLDRVPITGLAADSREVKPGYLFAALPGVKTDGARFIADALQRGAAAVLVAQGATARTDLRGDHRGQRSAPAPRADRGALLRPPAQDRGRRHRHQRQDLGRLLRAPALGGAGVRGGEPRHGRRGQPVRHQDPQPHDAGPDRAARASSPRSPRTASPISRSKPRATACNSAASTASCSPPAPSPTFRAIIWTITRASRTISTQKLRLFTELLPQGAAAVVDVDSEAGRRVAAVAEARGLKLVSVGRDGKTLRLVSAERDGFAPAPRHRA